MNKIPLSSYSLFGSKILKHIIKSDFLFICSHSLGDISRISPLEGCLGDDRCLCLLLHGLLLGLVGYRLGLVGYRGTLPSSPACHSGEGDDLPRERKPDSFMS